MSRIVLIQAGPTQWDVDDRVVGNHPLPLIDEAKAKIESIARGIDSMVVAVYRFKKNEACDQAAKIAALTHKVRTSESTGLDEWNLGLWQGLTKAEARFRYPTVLAQWEEDPLSVIPPDGEPLVQAIDRIRAALKKILKRRPSGTIIIVMRPLSMTMAAGILRGQQSLEIARGLQNHTDVETIDIKDEDLPRLFA